MATSTARKAVPARKPPTARPARKAARKAAPPGAAAPIEPPKQRRDAAHAAATGADDQPKKLKLVRDSVTMPKLEYRVIDILKTRASRLGRPAKKSEILRAGVEAMSDAEFLACVSSLPAAKAARTKP